VTKCILITGPGHSGTRLLVQLLAKHPQVSVPVNVLDGVLEYAPLGVFFTGVMDKTPLYSEHYCIDYEELRFILDAYLRTVDPTKPYFVLKIPFKALICLPFFIEYFGQDIVLIFTRRPTEKILNSFKNRNEDKLFFVDRSENMFRWLKRLSVKDREEWLVSLEPDNYFRRYVARCEALRHAWDAEHPEKQFIVVEVEQLARYRQYCAELLESIGLSSQEMKEISSVIDKNRLLYHAGFRFTLLRTILRRFALAIVPPVLVALARRLKRRWK
jgi:hypothetical protein